MPLKAGQAALRRGAWSEAKKAFARAIESDPSAAAHEGLGWSLYWLRDVERSLAEREIAYRMYLDGGDRVSAARVAIGIAVGSYDVAGAAVAMGWLERARGLLRRAPATVIHGWLAFYEGHVARIDNDDARAALRQARRAAQIAVRFGDTQLELLARALEGLAMVNQGRVADGMRRIDEATAAAMAGEMADLDSVAQTCCMLLYACQRVRDYKRGAQWQKRIGHFCKQWKLGPLFDVCSTQHAAMLTGCGDWRAAEKELEEALERLEKSRAFGIPDVLVQLADLRRRQGRYDDALGLIRNLDTRSEALLTRAAIALDSGDPVAAIEFAERLLSRKSGEKWVERATALQIVVAAAGGERARSAYAELKRIADRVDISMIRGIERRAAGDLAAAAGSLEEARAAYVESVEEFESTQAPFEAACARVLLASVLTRLGRESAARLELEQATAAFDSLGAAREREKLAVRETPLTRRECEVLHLIADGLGDKELATRLSLSEHTVHRHVSNILRKLNAGSRSAAVALAVRGGWL